MSRGTDSPRGGAPPRPALPSVSLAVPLALYIHLPFCLSRCRYCAFNSRPLEGAPVEDYLRALEWELGRMGGGERPAVGTVYLGGGTPTVLDAGLLERVLGAVRDGFRLLPGAEVTAEANPGTVDRAKARLLRDLGVNRVSLGVQSLRDDDLRLLGRAHTARQALESFRLLRQEGFANVGMDLIWGLPGQTGRSWEEDLGRVLELGAEHLSLYALTLERGTPLARLAREGKVKTPGEAEELAIYRAALRMTAAAGYGRYEIANWARPGFECRHNLGYWTGGDYLGAGAGAHSFRGGAAPVRRANVRGVEAYIRRWRAGRSPVAWRETLSPRTMRAEALMLGLRLMAGVSVTEYRERFGDDPRVLFREELEPSRERGLLAEGRGRLRLTPRGVLLSNEVFAPLF